MNADKLQQFKSLIEISELPTLAQLTHEKNKNSAFKNNIRYYCNTEVVTEENLAEFVKKPITIHFRRIQNSFPAIMQICKELEKLSGYTVSCNAFHSQPHCQALPAHEDLDDSFIYQMEGVKHWKVWKRYHHELSLQNLAKEQNKKFLEDWMKLSTPSSFTLRKNECYLLAAGHPHMAWTESEESLHYTFLVLKNGLNKETQEY